MYYGDKRESKVNLMKALINEGWKIYGYDPDQSDSMTDYYHPASWDGICSKNGYILVVDNNSNHYSGYIQKEYTYNQNHSNNIDKINKLKNMTIEKGCTIDEQKAAQEMISKLQEKNVPKEKILETYPVFKNGNPENHNWHIEDENGIILEKGTGAFAFNGMPYHWNYGKKEVEEGSYLGGQSYADAVTDEQRKVVKKLYDFVGKIEKAINNPKYCYVPTIEKKIIKVLKPVQVDRTEIKLGDVLSFSYHGHYWKVYNESEKSFTYQLLGSASKGYKETKNGKRYYDSKTNLKKGIEEGKVKIHELREVDEAIEKTVLKKVSYSPENKQKENNETIVITGEISEVTEQAQKSAITEIKSNIEVKFNEEKNGIELHFADKPSEEIRTLLKENGFRWSKYGKFWYAKDTQERRDFIKSLQSPEEVDEVTESVEESEELSNIIDLEEIKKERENQAATEQKEEQKENIEEVESVSFDFDNVLGKFDNIDITSGSRLSQEDQEEVHKYEEVFNQTKEKIFTTINFFESNNCYTYTTRAETIEYYKLCLIRESQNLKNAICYYFEKKYNVNLENIKDNNYIEPNKSYFSHHEKNYDKYISITAEQVINSIFDSLGGFTFAEKQDSEIKQNFSETFKYSKEVKVNKNKIVIPSSHLITYCSIFKRYEISYHVEEKFKNFLKGINYFEFGDANNSKLNFIFSYENHPNSINRSLKEDILFQKHEVGNKLTWFKIYKNKKVEIEFKTPELARQFAREYLGLAVNVA